MNVQKLRSILLGILIVGGIFASWSFGFNQLGAALEKAHAVQERSVLAECVTYGAPHAVVADGKGYCYMIFYGSEQMISLEELQQLHKKPPSTEGT